MGTKGTWERKSTSSKEHKKEIYKRIRGENKEDTEVPILSPKQEMQINGFVNKDNDHMR